MTTIIEKIRAEVLRLIRETDGPGSQYGFGKMSACNRILNFLDTIQEQPVCEGLEKEITKWFAELDKKYGVTIDFGCDGIAQDCFIAGAKWQAEKDARDMYMSDNRHFEKVYQLGRTDMREQMMRSAVEGKVRNIILHENGDEVHYSITYPKGKSQYSINDKIKIIIL